MKKIIALIAFVACVSPIFAQDWQKLDIVEVVDVAVANNGTFFVAKSNGVVRTSTDAGASHFKIPLGNIDAVRISINSDGSVVGLVNRNGVLWLSKDGGANWTKSSMSGVVDVSVGRSYSFLCTNDGSIYYSKDLNTWTKTSLSKADKVIFGGPFIIYTTPGGKLNYAPFDGKPNMMNTRIDGISGIVDIDVSPAGDFWAVTSDGKLRTSSDKGKTWTVDPNSNINRTSVSTCNNYTMFSNMNHKVFIGKN